MKIVEPWVVQMAKQGMRLVVTDGTGKRPMQEELMLEQAGILTAEKPAQPNIVMKLPGSEQVYVWELASAFLVFWLCTL
jgi:hypothetical protein